MNENNFRPRLHWHFIIFILFVIFFISGTNYALEPVVRVKILHTKEPVKIKFNGSWEINNGNSKSIIENNSVIDFKAEENNILFEGGELTPADSGLIKLTPINNSGTIDIFDVPYGVGWWWEGKEQRNYEGDVLLRLTEDNNIEVIISLPVETYLKGVVPYEIGGNSPLEALKAQAVAARSEAFAALASGLYGGRFHDLTSDVECQVFSGNKKRTEISDRAVEETRTIVLMENNEVINAYYSSNCGGHSEEIKYVWPDRPEKESYKVSGRDWDNGQEIDLRDEGNVRDWVLSIPDSYCNPEGGYEVPSWSSKNYRWQVDFTNEQISEMFADKDYGMLINIEPLERGASGRISKAKFIFEKNEIIADSELKIRLLFTPPLRSSCFVVDKDENGFHFKGAGWGHGVGMCQSGAVAQAIEGKSFEEILKHYYRKTELKAAY
ncbi:MAG: SpoIID/LytB domain-containing protein [Bacteroidetes bacterium]|nr:SpoIID/LytB domain-containing protein [Bacteroidota bacterium]